MFVRRKRIPTSFASLRISCSSPKRLTVRKQNVESRCTVKTQISPRSRKMNRNLRMVQMTLVVRNMFFPIMGMLGDIESIEINRISRNCRIWFGSCFLLHNTDCQGLGYICHSLLLLHILHSWQPSRRTGGHTWGPGHHVLVLDPSKEAVID